MSGTSSVSSLVLAGLSKFKKQLFEIWPGFLIACTIAVTASYLSDHHGGPVMLFALLLGMAFHFLSQDAR